MPAARLVMSRDVVDMIMLSMLSGVPILSFDPLQRRTSQLVYDARRILDELQRYIVADVSDSSIVGMEVGQNRACSNERTGRSAAFGLDLTAHVTYMGLHRFILQSSAGSKELRVVDTVAFDDQHGVRTLFEREIVPEGRPLPDGSPAASDMTIVTVKSGPADKPQNISSTVQFQTAWPEDEAVLAAVRYPGITPASRQGADGYYMDMVYDYVDGVADRVHEFGQLMLG